MSPDTREGVRALDSFTDEELGRISRRLLHDPQVLDAEGFAGWWRRWAGTIAFASLLLVAAIGITYVQHVASQSKTALCAFRTDLSARVAQTHVFLAHPKRYPSFSDPQTVALIRQQVAGQERTIATLGALDCP